MVFTPTDVDLKAINTIRTLAADIVAKSKSGHPGAPMGLAPLAHLLWSRVITCDPKDSKWLNRDRFVLSNGHACALQYIMLHLMGYQVTMDDLKAFRQLNSKTPGHPEANHTDGVEVTTGPLGQGFATAVGLAIAERNAAAAFNKEGFELFNNYTYTILGDGCMQEGVASEAASLAGHLGLYNLIAFYDDNSVTIDGDTNVSFTEDVTKRFESYGWNVIPIEDGDNDIKSVFEAIEKAHSEKIKPTLISIKTTIGFGSKNQGTASTHGAPLKADDIEQLKEKFGFDPKETFVVPDEVAKAYASYAQRGAEKHAEWTKMFEEYGKKYEKEHSEILRRAAHKLPDGWEKCLPRYQPSDKPVATRKLSEMVLQEISSQVPEILGGSADLTGSNLTRWAEATDFQNPKLEIGNYAGRYLRYGVREHAMGAIMNGLHAYGLHIPTAGTFLNFVTYAWGAVRLSSLSHFQVIWVATHDSIGLGEDGPTHQPIEVAAALRALPNMDYWRPADGNEVSAAYKVALESPTTPSVLSLTRQNLPHLDGSSIEKASQGGYVVMEVPDAAITLVSTGSEVSICRDAAVKLNEQGIKARLVSLPCFSVFDKQPLDYRLSVLPSGHPILSVEAYSTLGWGKYAHVHHGINAFGVSAPYQQAYEHFHMTDKDVAEKAAKVVEYYKSMDQKLYSPVEVEAHFNP
ncbi:transketolase [Malassezia equina]|uniref:Transketolase n=1 Tax=Malassezia equina TaxID=1381935 RepID=A0AAF0E850_9BASI|nr:transketolase [Malassezia equina]